MVPVPSFLMIRSKPFNFTTAVNAIRMKNEHTINKSYITVLSGKLMHHGITCYVFEDREKMYQINNHLHCNVRVQQIGYDLFDIIEPKSEINWGWDLPNNEPKLLIQVKKKMLEVNFHSSEKQHIKFKKTTIVAECKIENDVRVLDIRTIKSSRLKEPNQVSKYNIKLASVGISFINDYPRELMYISIDNCEVQYTVFDNEKKNIALTISDFQVRHFL